MKRKELKENRKIRKRRNKKKELDQNNKKRERKNK